MGGEYDVGHSVAADDTAVYWAAVDGKAVPGPDGSVDTTPLIHRITKVAK